MGTDNKWTDRLKQKMSDYSIPEPEGLWENIDSALPAQKPLTLPWKRALWLVPAAAAACLGVFGIIRGLVPEQLPESGDSMALVTRGDVSTDDSPSGTADITVEEAFMEDMTSITVKYADNIDGLLAQNDKKVASSEKTGHIDAVTLCPEESATDIRPAEKKEEPEKTSKSQSGKQSKLTDKDIERIMESYAYNEKQDSRKRFADNLSVSMRGKTGLDGKKMTSSANLSSPKPSSITDLLQDATVTKSAQMSHAKYKDSEPVKYEWRLSYEVDILVQKYFSDRFSLVSGLGWTIMDGISSNGSVRADYIGIPIQAGIDLFKTERLQCGVYAGVKGSLALNGNADSGRQKFLMSVGAGLNAAVPVTDYLALRIGFGADRYFETKKNGRKMFGDEGRTVACISAGLVLGL